MASKTWIGFFLWGLGTTACSADAFLNWKVEAAAGYLLPTGAIHETFGSGINASLLVGRRMFSDVVAEGGVRLGDVGFSAARSVTTRECLAVPPGRPLCATGPAKQRGSYTGLTLGISVPVMADRRGRVLQVGAGGLLGRYSISPGGDDLGSRHGPGFYVKLAGDLFPLGSTGGIGLLARCAVVFTHGDSLGPRLPSETSDTWLDFNVVFRTGPPRRRSP